MLKLSRSTYLRSFSILRIRDSLLLYARSKAGDEMAILKQTGIWLTVYTPPSSGLPFLAVTHLPTGDVSAVPFRTYEEAEAHIASMVAVKTHVLNEVLDAKGS